MEKAIQIQRAQEFLALHKSKKLLILPNAWDAGSAVLFEKAGFSAIGTTSAGIAYSLGYPDGQMIGLDDLMEAQEKMLRRIKTPLSVDLETGYGNGPEEIRESVRRVILGGAVGLNIEDGIAEGGLREVSEQVEIIQAISSLKEETGIPFVINARTDVYWLSIGEAEERLSRVLERAARYQEAGADCIFVPGIMEGELLETLTREIKLPLNVIATPKITSVGMLEGFGTARLSLGSGPARAALGAVRNIAESLMESGTFESMFNSTIPYAEANRLFE